ncbi:MAG: GntR family transcriptional regulator [Roseburia sp.]|nr:GntR family transcriptional regulator [Roseburia sp.]
MAEDNYSLGSRVFHKIREGILSGKYAANEELKEKNIGDELGVSRTPVREALRQLELEGLVSIIPNKGAYVVGLSKKDIRDIYEMRSLLEGLCAKWAAVNVTEEQLNELEENIFLSEFHAGKQNWEQMVELDNRFHEILYLASGSKELKHILTDYHQYVQRVRKVTLAEAKRVQESTEEHKVIVEALKKHDPEKAEEAATIHIRNTVSNMDKIGWDNLIK